MIRIPLTRGYEAVIDDEDAHLAAFRWHAKIDRAADGSPQRVYARRSERREDGRYRHLYLHREVLGVGPRAPVDHEDHDGLNCRRGNLRAATVQQNNANTRRRPDNGSGFKGVHRDRSGGWRAQIRVNRVRYHLGIFNTPEEAAAAYDDAARKFFGPFACTNLPAATEAA